MILNKLEEQFKDLDEKQNVKNVDNDMLILDEDERWEKILR